MIKPVLEFFGAQEFGGAMIEFGQRVNEADVTVNGALSLAVKGEMLNEFLP